MRCVSRQGNNRCIQSLLVPRPVWIQSHPDFTDSVTLCSLQHGHHIVDFITTVSKTTTLFELHLNQARINVQPRHDTGTCTSRGYRGYLMHFIIVLFRAVCQRLTLALQSHAPQGLDMTTRAQSAGPEEGGDSANMQDRTGGFLFYRSTSFISSVCSQALETSSAHANSNSNQSFHIGCDASTSPTASRPLLHNVSWRKTLHFLVGSLWIAPQALRASCSSWELQENGSPSSVEGAKTCRPAPLKVTNQTWCVIYFILTKKKKKKYENKLFPGWSADPWLSPADRLATRQRRQKPPARKTDVPNDLLLSFSSIWKRMPGCRYPPVLSWTN